MADKGYTPDKLDYNKFKLEWWSKESREQALDILKNSRTKQINRDADELLKEKGPQEFIEGGNKETESRCVMEAESSEDSHAFHLLMLS